MTSALEPPSDVLTAFGLTGRPQRLPGGRGRSWQVGDVVLKPDVDPRFQEWLGTEMAAVEQHGFRLPPVVRALGGSWVVRGWGAWEEVPHEAHRPSQLVHGDLSTKVHAEFVPEPFTITTELSPKVFPEQPVAGPFAANLGGFLSALDGEPSAWCEPLGAERTG